jgi:hypothetical protein
MSTCWVCHENINLDSHTAWVVEHDATQSNNNVPKTPAHKECAIRAIGQRGPGGHRIVGYQLGATKPNGSGLILRK